MPPAFREVLSVWSGKQLSKPYVNSTPRIVILSFWATWCQPCQREIPELVKFAEKHAADSIKIFLVSLDEKGAAEVGPFVAQKGWKLPVLLDPYRKTAERYGVTSLPALFFISPGGVIRYSTTGMKKDVDFAAALETIYDAIKNNRTLPANYLAGGETVDVPASGATPPPAVSAAPVKPAPTTAQKFSAAARIESGLKPDSVAKALGVTIGEIKQWHEELKGMAAKLWLVK